MSSAKRTNRRDQKLGGFIKKSAIMLTRNARNARAAAAKTVLRAGSFFIFRLWNGEALAESAGMVSFGMVLIST